MKPDQCMFFTTKDKTGKKDLALTVKKMHKYKDIGFFAETDVKVDKWDGKESKNEFQKWKWDKKTDRLYALGHTEN